MLQHEVVSPLVLRLAGGRPERVSKQRQLHTGVSHLPTTTALLHTYTMALTPRQ